MKFKAFIHYFIQFTWGLPQNLLGLLLFLLGLVRGRYAGKYNRAFITKTKKIHGLSLGVFIFVSDESDAVLLRHEYGHTLQSLYLGVFYLLIIGLPSLIWAGLFNGYRKKHNVDYYSFYTERWANHLSGPPYAGRCSD